MWYAHVADGRSRANRAPELTASDVLHAVRADPVVFAAANVIFVDCGIIFAGYTIIQLRTDSPIADHATLTDILFTAVANPARSAYTVVPPVELRMLDATIAAGA